MIKHLYHGTSLIISVRKKSLKHKFEVLQMTDLENIQEYITRVVSIVNQIKGFGLQLSEENVVSKVLRSLAPKYDMVVVAIEEAGI